MPAFSKAKQLISSLFYFNCARKLPMQVKVELSVSEIEEALKQYVAHKMTINGYLPVDSQFIYEGSDDEDSYRDDYQQIIGAFAVMSVSNPDFHALPARAESIAPEGWRSA